MNENGEVNNVIYSSSYITNKEFYQELSSINYNRVKKMFLFGFCFAVFETLVKIFDTSYDLGFGGIIIPICMFVIYLKTNSQTEQNYERHCVSAGKESIASESLCEKSIVSSMDELKREFYYHQITRFFESKKLLLLHLKHQLYIIINKETLNANVDEVKAFLIEKCSKVGNKKFINCSNDKRWCLILLIATIILYVIGVIVSIVFEIQMSIYRSFTL